MQTTSKSFTSDASFQYFRESYRIITAQHWMHRQYSEWSLVIRRHSSAANLRRLLNNYRKLGFSAIFASCEWFAVDHGRKSTWVHLFNSKLTKKNLNPNVALDSGLLCDWYGHVIIIELNQWNDSDWDKRQSRIRNLFADCSLNPLDGHCKKFAEIKTKFLHQFDSELLMKSLKSRQFQWKALA